MNAKISAKMIAHSINPEGKELMSIEIIAPYFLDAEIEKHGAICSNSSSNRAIPFKTLLEADYYIPTDIRKNQKGMQGFEKINGFELHPWVESVQEIHNTTAAILNNINDELDIHKQHLNRYLAPFSMQKKIMTGTREAWNGVMLLRDHPDADPSIQIWAKEIHNLLKTSKPIQLAWDEWHLPYITEEEMALPLNRLLIMSTARCARTSQRLHDGQATSFEADERTYHMLIDSNPMHETPLEHQAMCVKKPTNIYNSNSWLRGQTHLMRDGNIGSGRLIGWIQHRHWLEK